MTVIDGRATLTAKNTAAVTKDGKPVGTFQADHIVIATGARPRALPGMEPDGKTYLDLF